MNVLFTGGSSFSGFWFVKELSNAGLKVYCTFTGKDLKSYEGIRKERINLLENKAALIFDCPFGSEKFLDLVSTNEWSIFCHHAAVVKDYKSEQFDIAGAIKANTHNAELVIKTFAARGCSKIILTGSVFEKGEGSGDETLQAFSPYGLSKSFSYDIFEYFARKSDLTLGKFVIPNPFGPFEEPRFTQYLIRNWFEDKIPAVNTPLYVRDNIHISLLAKVYLYFLQKCLNTPNGQSLKINPSGYIETQADFTARLANEMRDRLKLKCNYELKTQTDFFEPMSRFNTEPAKNFVPDWDETEAWNQFAEYYKTFFSKVTPKVK
ncbi:MAG: NAD(P)-dependent oxidoreductase [Ignavibacteriaceae bacterium]|nr:NAD(P)-dependent oxidoreductase [Ignavibacteriaceae bacterium]